MIKYVLAIFFPGIAVVLFSRVTYNQYIGLIIAVAFIAASVYKGHTDSWLLIILDAFSLTVGLWYSTKMLKKIKQNA